ncbi:hypothetical protein [Vibrio rotiferianus]|uniref:hypothetical protein n=1 Tax=Vibrio rotiferianus TaxID=190895 RepID=UPI0005768527|nr:hypothetical protein [Vibrio rotiferianus]PIB10664.1 hypothetical protein B853_24512 [Vibrio rotiferianus CAIM 577 = LMG 21460]
MKYKSVQSLREPQKKQNELRALLLIALIVDNNARSYKHSSSYHTHWGAMLDGVDLGKPEYHPTFSEFESSAFDHVSHIWVGDGPIEQWLYALVEEIFSNSGHLEKLTGINPSVHVSAARNNQVFICFEDDEYETGERLEFNVRLNHRNDKVVEHGIEEDTDEEY